MKYLGVLLGLYLIACSPSQQGGGEPGCLCMTATAWVITATPIGGSATPSPTATKAPTPTMLPTPAITSTPNPADCPGYPMAAYVKGMSYTVTKIYRQYIRSVPDSSRSDTITGYLYRDKPRHVWFTFGGWFALTQVCDTWIWSGYGELYPEMTQ